MTERVRWLMQARIIRFLVKEIQCLKKFVKLKFEKFSTSIRFFSRSKDLSLDSLHRIRRMFHVCIRLAMYAECFFQERLHKQTLHAKENGKKPVGRPGTKWLHSIKDLGWKHLEFCRSKMQSVLVDLEVWLLNLELLLLQQQHSRKSGWRKKKDMP